MGGAPGPYGDRHGPVYWPFGWPMNPQAANPESKVPWPPPVPLGYYPLAGPGGHWQPGPLAGPGPGPMAPQWGPAASDPNHYPSQSSVIVPWSNGYNNQKSSIPHSLPQFSGSVAEGWKAKIHVKDFETAMVACNIPKIDAQYITFFSMSLGTTTSKWHHHSASSGSSSSESSATSGYEPSMTGYSSELQFLGQTYSTQGITPAKIWFDSEMTKWEAQYQKDAARQADLNRNPLSDEGERIMVDRALKANPSRSWESLKKEFILRFDQPAPLQAIQQAISMTRLTGAPVPSVSYIVQVLEHFWALIPPQFQPPENQKVSELLAALDVPEIQEYLYDNSNSLQAFKNYGDVYRMAISKETTLRTVNKWAAVVESAIELRKSLAARAGNDQGDAKTSTKTTGGRRGNVNAITEREDEPSGGQRYYNKGGYRYGRDRDSNVDKTDSGFEERIARAVAQAVMTALKEGGLTGRRSQSLTQSQSRRLPQSGSEEPPQSPSDKNRSEGTRLRSGKIADGDLSQVECKICHKLGHMMRSCPERKDSKESSSWTVSRGGFKGGRRGGGRNRSSSNTVDIQGDESYDEDDNEQVNEVQGQSGSEEEYFNDEQGTGDRVGVIQVCYEEPHWQASPYRQVSQSLTDSVGVSTVKVKERANAAATVSNTHQVEPQESIQSEGDHASTRPNIKVVDAGSVVFILRDAPKAVPLQVLARISQDREVPPLIIIIDTGSGATLLSYNVFKRLPPEIKKRLHPLPAHFKKRKYSSATNGPLIPIGILRLRLRMGRVTTKHIPFLVMRNLYSDALIGNDVLSDEELFGPISVSERTIEYRGGKEAVKVKLMSTAEDIDRKKAEVRLAADADTVGNLTMQGKRGRSRSPKRVNFKAPITVTTNPKSTVRLPSMTRERVTVTSKEKGLPVPLAETQFHTVGSVSLKKSVEVPAGGEILLRDMDSMKITGVGHFRDAFEENGKASEAKLVVSQLPSFSSAVKVQNTVCAPTAEFLAGKVGVALHLTNMGKDSVTIHKGERVALVEAVWDEDRVEVSTIMKHLHAYIEKKGKKSKEETRKGTGSQ